MKSESVSVAFLHRHIDRERGQLEELDLPLIDGPLFHHVARDPLEGQLDFGVGRLLFSDFVHLEGEVPAEHVDAVRPGRVLARAHRLLEFDDHVLHVADRHRGLDPADVNHPPALDAVQPGPPGHRLGRVELQDEFDVLAVPLCIIGKARSANDGGKLVSVSVWK